jgi:hypothetical protein
MNAQTILYTILKVAGGYAVARGLATQSDWTVTTGVISALAGWAWNHFHLAALTSKEPKQ